MSLFTRWFGAKKNVNSAKAVKPRARLNVESLEERNMMAVDAFIWFEAPAPTTTEHVGDVLTQKVSVATGDINGDRIDDIILGAGPGAVGGHVKVFDGRSGALIRSFMAFEGFSGGVNVAAGDVNGDGFADIITGTATANTHVKVFSGADGALLRSFLAFPGFNGGVSVASGDVNGDGRADIITGAGAGANGHVKVFSGADGSLLASFYAFPGFNGGVSVAAGDINGDGFDDIIVGAAMNGHVKAFSGKDGALLQSFFAFSGFNGSVSVGAGDVDCDGSVEIIVVADADAAGGHVKVFDGVTGAMLPAFEIKDFSFGVENPTTIGSATGGAGAGKAEFAEFTITTPTDAASPVFFKNCCAGAHYKTVVIEMRKAGGDADTAGKPYLKFTFGTVFTTKIDWTGPGDEGPEESITFVYGKLGVNVDPTDPNATAVSGRATGIAVDPVDPDTTYVGTANGGVWKTTNRF